MSHFFKTKADFWEALHRDGIYTPTLESSICTIKWLEKVYYGDQWCPKYTELQLRPCTRKPIKACFLNEIQRLLKQKNLKPMIFDEKHTPDVFWCWISLATLDPNHPFFEKSYIPTEEEKGRKSNVDKKTLISQQEAAFLKNLPSQLFKKNLHQDMLNSDDEDEKFELLPFSSAAKSQRQPNIKQNNPTLGYLQEYRAQANQSVFSNIKNGNQMTMKNPNDGNVICSQSNPMFNFTPQQNRSMSKPKNLDKQSDISMQFNQVPEYEPGTITKRKNHM